MPAKSRFYARGIWVDAHLDPWITTIVIMIHFGLAVAILVGGIERFSLPSYGPLIEYTGGQVWIWGVWIMSSALFMGMPFRWMNIIGLWLGMAWNIIWMACFAVAVLESPTSAGTPIPVYGGLAMICAALLTARIIDTSKV